MRICVMGCWVKGRPVAPRIGKGCALRGRMTQGRWQGCEERVVERLLTDCNDARESMRARVLGERRGDGGWIGAGGGGGQRGWGGRGGEESGGWTLPRGLTRWWGWGGVGFWAAPTTWEKQAAPPSLRALCI